MFSGNRPYAHVNTARLDKVLMLAQCSSDSWYRTCQRVHILWSSLQEGRSSSSDGSACQVTCAVMPSSSSWVQNSYARADKRIAANKHNQEQVVAPPWLQQVLAAAGEHVQQETHLGYRDHSRLSARTAVLQTAETASSQGRAAAHLRQAAGSWDTEGCH